jgi:outer membrane protein insertion porin family
VTRVDVVIEGTQNSNVAEMKSLLDVAPGQDYSPVRIHDSLVRLYRSGLISGALVEASNDGANGVALRFVVRPQARIENVVFEGTPIFPAAELKARLNQLDPGERLSIGAVTRGLGDLTAYYSARGYYQSKIAYEVRLDPSSTRATVAYNITPGEQARVSTYKLTVTGDKIDLTKVKPAIIEGQPFNQALLQEVMDHIKEAYLKQDYLAVRVNVNTSPDAATNSVAVGINIESGPRVEVVIAGLPIDAKQRNKVLPFYTQGGVDDFTLEEGRRSLLDYVQREGYFFADVTRPDAPDLSKPSVKLTYTIDAGARYTLSDIEIEGVDAVPHRTLEDEMKSKPASPFPLVGGRGVTSDDMLRQDANLISKRLRSLGYRRAHVDVRRGVSLKGERLIITFDVEQGPRTYVEEIGMRGNQLMSTGELSKRISIKPGDPLVESVVANDSDQLLAAYTAPGFATAEVAYDAVDLGSIDGQDRVRLIFNITEGNRVRIRGITTRGAAVTSTGRLERDFYLFRTGDWLRMDQLQETERQLYETNAFNSITINSDVVGQTVNGIEERDVTVNVLESKRRDVVYGLGYQTNTANTKTVPGLNSLGGVRGLTQLTYSNLFGKLYTGSTQLRVSQNELFGQISFQNPRPFGTNLPALISLFARRLGEKSFRTDRYTMNFQLEKRYSLDFIVYFSYYFERISIFDLPPPCEEITPDCNGLTVEEIQRDSQPIRLGRIGPSFLRDKRDNKFDPTSGNQTLGSFFVAATALGGNEQFVKFYIEHDRFYPIRRFRDTVFSVSGRLGLASPFGGKDSLPISERFFGGGARDLRGFGFEEAGPQAVVPKRDSKDNIIVDANNQVVTVLSPKGGNAVLVINNELRFPLFGPIGGVVFSDTGNVFERVRDIKPGNITETVGFGLRLKTPIGPVRFDYGFLVVNKPDGVSRSHKHFTIGQTF